MLAKGILAIAPIGFWIVSASRSCAASDRNLRVQLTITSGLTLRNTPFDPTIDFAELTSGRSGRGTGSKFHLGREAPGPQ